MRMLEMLQPQYIKNYILRRMVILVLLPLVVSVTFLFIVFRDAYNTLIEMHKETRIEQSNIKEFWQKDYKANPRR
ncbi:MAG TPA: hypothetical protein VIS27_07090 [Yeosuana sp.]